MLVLIVSINITTGHQDQPQEYDQLIGLSKYCIDTFSSDSGFSSRIAFSDRCVYHVLSVSTIRNNHGQGTEMLRENKEHKVFREK